MTVRIVSHPKFGRGQVVDVRARGFELYVLFDDNKKRWVRLNELIDPGLMPTPTPRTTQVSTPISFDHLKPRHMLEAFRLGIVPYDCVDTFTFGRNKEIEELKQWLEAEEDINTFLFVGEYGTGKSHLLNYAYYYALQQGFAVAHVEMDPREAPFYKPKRVYSRLIQSFRYPCKEDGQIKHFQDFMKEVLACNVFHDHIYFKHLIGNTTNTRIWEWIEAHEAAVAVPWSLAHRNYLSLPKLEDYSTTANVYCYLLTAMGWAAKQVLGLNGLVLIFDEAETLDSYVYNYQADKSLNFLKALTFSANNETYLLGHPGRTGLYYRRSVTVPFLYKQPSGLKLILAFTPRDFPDDLVDKIGSVMWIDLDPLTDTALKEVFEQICLLYQKAYNFSFQKPENNAVFRRITEQSGRTRLFVKGSVEALDLIRLRQGEGVIG